MTDHATDVDDPRTTLHGYLKFSRDALVWKLEGLSEYDIRRPLVPTGTNLLGLVKHVASVGLGYFGECMGRPSELPMPWFDPDAEPNADLWATPAERRDDILEFWRAAWAHADATIEALPLDARGHVPWWGPERDRPTLRTLLVHMIAEVARHAGQADIVRELVDGAAGLRSDNSNLPPEEASWWTAYYERVEAAARAAAAPSSPVHRSETTVP